MTAPSAFYRTCAAASLREANASPLANVRDQHLRAAKAWQMLAARAAWIESNRKPAPPDKAVEAEAEAPGRVEITQI